jgi:hypothetical protein
MVFSGLLMRRHSDGSARAEPPHTSANPCAHVGVGERVRIDGEVAIQSRMGWIYSYPKLFVLVVMRECELGRTGYVRDVEHETHTVEVFPTTSWNRPDNRSIRFHRCFT